ncbi:monodechloroaminopyrrolnitrin synthase PrnB family protein [Kitasatospora sp. MAP5-34]|uniref:monodechloroaminopyrrolnitrin synthase PrnB family protein n=1 Tax=Kitasatospora sp. MAP5-34 TaxID=3035102 RepID=UPI0024764A3B|nr:monodechloroaminopyrrolnitrin synthase PrnB family protein [Kitasatospora sp. MAP5-34]MDH6579332.1 hypothetical protein [Kitasatospora sp. MAP5-34]
MPSVSHVDLANSRYIEAARNLDPLHADALCRAAREMNSQEDVHGLAVALRRINPALEEVAGYSVQESLAAMRDLGLFLGSLKRHGVEPVEAVPEVAPVLLALGARTGMVPRDTVHHYTTWNPPGERQRMYTGDPQEGHLQESVRMVFPKLRDGLELCDRLSGTEIEDPGFALLVDELAEHLGAMVDCIDLVVGKVSPVFFARTLRPYFEDVTVDGTAFLGPAAAQAPLWLIDLALWASDRSAPEYAAFLADSIPYSLPRWRELYSRWLTAPSVVTRLVTALGRYQDGPAELPTALRAGAEALARALRVVVVFRGRHLGIARKAYEADLRLYPVGSGGASVDLLREILDLTRENLVLSRPRTPAAPATPDHGTPTSAVGLLPKQRNRASEVAR